MGVVRLFLLVLAMLLLAVPVKADIPGQLNALNESLGQLRGKLDTLQTKLEELGKKVTVTAVFPTPQGLGISEDKIWRLNQSTERIRFFRSCWKRQI